MVWIEPTRRAECESGPSPSLDSTIMVGRYSVCNRGGRGGGAAAAAESALTIMLTSNLTSNVTSRRLHSLAMIVGVVAGMHLLATDSGI